MESPRYHINIQADRPARLRQLAARHRLDLCFGSIRKEKRGFSMDVYLSPAEGERVMALLGQEGVQVQRLDDDPEEVALISSTNRYADGAIPRGVGQKR